MSVLIDPRLNVDDRGKPAYPPARPLKAGDSGYVIWVGSVGTPGVADTQAEVYAGAAGGLTARLSKRHLLTVDPRTGWCHGKKAFVLPAGDPEVEKLVGQIQAATEERNAQAAALERQRRRQAAVWLSTATPDQVAAAVPDDVLEQIGAGLELAARKPLRPSQES